VTLNRDLHLALIPCDALRPRPDERSVGSPGLASRASDIHGPLHDRTPHADDQELKRLALTLKASVKPASNYRCIHRFLKNITLTKPRSVDFCFTLHPQIHRIS
jgi:hypothetical protein